MCSVQERRAPDDEPTRESAPTLAAERGPDVSAAGHSRGRERLVAFFEVVLCSGFPTQILLIQILVLAGVSPLDPAGGLSASFVVALSLLDAGVLLTLILGFLILHGERPRDVFLGSLPIRGEVLLGAMSIPLVFLTVLILLVVILRFLPWLHNVPENPLEALIQTRTDAVVFAVVAIIAGGMREELQRAFILHRFEQHLGGAALGLILFSIAFGAGHVIQGYDAAVITGILGAFWGILYLVRRSVVAPVVSHAGFNLAEILRIAVTR